MRGCPFTRRGSTEIPSNAAFTMVAYASARRAAMRISAGALREDLLAGVAPEQ